MKPAPPVTTNLLRRITSDIIQEPAPAALTREGERPDATPARAGRSPFRLARYALVPLVTAGLLWYFLTRLPAGSIAGTFRHVSAAPLAISIAGAAVFMLARAWRYRVLLTTTGAEPPAFGPEAAVTFA